MKVLLESLFFFNINITFGGAETLALIMRKVDKSFKEAKRLSKIYQKLELTEEE
jgi:hypothetical protein